MAINDPIHPAPEMVFIEDPGDLNIDDLQLLYNIRMNQIKISSSPDCQSASSSQILKGIAQLGVSINVVNIRPNEIAFAIHRGDTENVKAALEKDGYSVKLLSPCVNIVISSRTVRGISNLIPDLLDRFAEKNIRILQLSVSYTEISLLITEDLLGKVTAIFNERHP